MLYHGDLAAQFQLYVESGTSLPKYTKPTLDLRDQHLFSAITQNRFDAINLDYQKEVCSLLQRHHEEMIERSKLMLKLRLDTSNRLYNAQSLTDRMNKVSRQESLDAYTSGLNKRQHPRQPRLGDKRPHT